MAIQFNAFSKTCLALQAKQFVEVKNRNTVYFGGNKDSFSSDQFSASNKKDGGVKPNALKNQMLAIVAALSVAIPCVGNGAQSNFRQNKENSSISFTDDQAKKLLKIADQNDNGKIDNTGEQKTIKIFFDKNQDGQIDPSEIKDSLAFLDKLDLSYWDNKHNSTNVPIELKKGWDQISVKHQQHLLSDPNTKIRVTNYMTKIPELKNQTVFGTLRGISLDYTSGINDRRGVITMAENAKALGTNQFSASSPESYQADFQHELGHTICEHFGIENSEEFKQAFVKDLSNMSGESKEKLFYYVQKSSVVNIDPVGLSESCAQGYTNAASPQNQKDGNINELFMNKFPNTISYMKNNIRK